MVQTRSEGSRGKVFGSTYTFGNTRRYIESFAGFYGFVKVGMKSLTETARKECTEVKVVVEPDDGASKHRVKQGGDKEKDHSFR